MATEPPSEDVWTKDEQDAFLGERAERKKERLALYETLERRLEIPVGYIDHLFGEEDDWAYIVKVAVLCEAAVTHSLVQNVGSRTDADAWYEHFADLPNNRRINLALKLRIINKRDRDVLDAIAQVRNSFAHEVKNLGGSLSTFFSNLHVDRKVELSTKLLGIKHNKTEQDWSFYTANTKLLIGVGLMVPIKSLAQYGLDREHSAQLQKQFELADLFRNAPDEFQAWKSVLSGVPDEPPVEIWDSLPPVHR